MRKTITVYQIDSFTDRLFGGNPAAVVVDASDLIEQQMQQIANEMNLSETAFVLAPTGNADVRLRYFTPSTEVKFCGHATIATLFVLAKNKLHGLGANGSNPVTIETAAGLYTMAVKNSGGNPRMSFTVPEPKLTAYHVQGEQFAKEFGIANIVDAKAHIYVEETPQKFVFVPVVSKRALLEMTYDPQLVQQRFGDTDTVIFCFYAKGEGADDADLHVRSFGPLIGIIEDPFTGAVQAGALLSAKHNHYVAPNANEYNVAQGQAMNRPGVAQVSHAGGTVTVSATATQVFSAEMEV